MKYHLVRQHSEAAIQQQHQEIARRKQAIAAATARLNNSQVTLNPTDAEIAIATENIEREKATGQATLSSLRQEKEALIQQQIELQQQQTRDRQESQQLEKDLAQTAIKATADGILFQLDLRNPGQTVTAGAAIAQIAPLERSLTVQALVSASEIERVKLNRPVQIKVSACPYPDYGTLKGVVRDIAPDALAPETNSASSSGFYPVAIEPELLSLGKGKNQCKLQIGMEGKAEIMAQEETLLQFLLRKARLISDL